ncbi:MAG: hypothetical protein BWY06_01378 [Candidatus Latescibacteria bacterium ADurb.Bin168]|nr:MAG: hypothetical protein BWY06_01378 [Candidatus Latescibacteria bacterium ADurb.Bin168]
MIHPVAQPDYRGSGSFSDCPTYGRHGVAVVEEQCVGCEFQDVFRNIHHRRNHPQRAAGASRSHRIADRLVNTVFPRNKHVLFPRTAPSHAHCANDRGGALQHLRAILRRFELPARTSGCDHFPGKIRGDMQRRRISVDERQFALRPCVEQIGHKPARERNASRANQNDSFVHFQGTPFLPGEGKKRV